MMNREALIAAARAEAAAAAARLQQLLAGDQADDQADDQAGPAPAAEPAAPAVPAADEVGPLYASFSVIGGGSEMFGEHYFDLVTATAAEMDQVVNDYRFREDQPGDLLRHIRIPYSAELGVFLHWLRSTAPPPVDLPPKPGVRSVQRFAVGGSPELYARYVADVSALMRRDPFYAAEYPVVCVIPMLIDTRRRAVPPEVRAAANDLATDLVDAIYDAVPGAPTEAVYEAELAAVRARRRGVREAAFKAYRLLLGDKELLDLLGLDDWHTDDAPTASMSPWRNYAEFSTPAGKNDPNCIINELIERYSAAGSSRISPKAIRAAFSAGAPTIEDLAAFAAQYKIPLRVYNGVSSKPIVDQAASGSGSRRRGLAIIAWGEHAWIHTGNTIQASTPVRVAGLPNAIAAPTAAYVNNEKLEEDIYRSVLRHARPCFYYSAEAAVTLKSYVYSEPSRAGATYASIDMVKAYYQGIHHRDAAADLIGCYTACDSIVPYRPGSGINPSATYWVSSEELRRWKDTPGGLLCSRKNNLLSGLELAALVAGGHVSLDDVTHVKLPGYTLPASTYRAQLANLEKEYPGRVRDGFAIYNGLFGISRRYAGVAAIATGEADADLIESTIGNVTVSDLPEAYYDEFPDTVTKLVSVRSGRDEYLYLSNRHLYNYAIARTNVAVLGAASQLAKRGFGWPVRVRVDGLTYDLAASGKTRDELAAAISELPHEFRLEVHTKRPDGLKPGSVFVDPEVVAAGVRDEVAAWSAQHRAYVGPPGTGKSYTVKNSHRGEYKYALALTNVCARQLDNDEVAGETLHSRLRLFCPDELGEVVSALKGAPIWIDELSQINPYIWSALFVVGLSSPLILTGDPRQCAPIKADAAGRIGSDPIPWSSPLMSRIVGGATRLTTEYRNDASLVEFRDAIYDEEHPTRYLEALLRRRPELDGDVASRRTDLLLRDTHLVWGHSYRVALNAAILESRNLRWEKRVVPRTAAAIPAARTKRGEAYTFSVDADIKVVARVTRKGSYNKGSFYRVVDRIDHDTAIVRLQPLAAGNDEPTGSPIDIQNSQLIDFSLGYAITIASSQGMTITGAAAVHQLGQLLRGGEHREIAYTAVTRFCNLDEILLVRGKLTLPPPPASQLEVWGLKDDEDLGAGLTPSGT